MSGSCGDWDNFVHPGTPVGVGLEIERAGCTSHRVSCRTGNIHHIFWSYRQYLAQKMVRLATLRQAQGRRDEKKHGEIQQAVSLSVISYSANLSL